MNIIKFTQEQCKWIKNNNFEELVKKLNFKKEVNTLENDKERKYILKLVKKFTNKIKKLESVENIEVKINFINNKIK